MLSIRVSRACLRGFTATRLSLRYYSVAVDSHTPKASKVWNSADEAVKDIKSGDILLCGGFGAAGIPGVLIPFRGCVSSLPHRTRYPARCPRQTKGCDRLDRGFQQCRAGKLWLGWVCPSLTVAVSDLQFATDMLLNTNQLSKIIASYPGRYEIFQAPSTLTEVISATRTSSPAF
jgi:hypothetical protein